MKKIPVGATITGAYRFAFGQFLNLVKLIWLPALIGVVLNLVVSPQMMVLTEAMRTHDYSGLTMPMPLVALLFALAWLASFMLVAGIFQFALDKDNVRGRFWYFSLGAPLWRLLGAFLLFILVMAALLLVYVLAAAAVLFLFRLGLTAAHISGTALTDIIAGDAALAFLAGYCGFIFCWVRFGFLLGATTIAEDRIGLVRSWTLSYRNFWRMFGVTLAIFLPFFALEMTAFVMLGAFPHVTPGATPAQVRAAEQAANALMMANMQHYSYLVIPLAMVAAVLLYGLMAGASTFAYRALTESEEQPAS